MVVHPHHTHLEPVRHAMRATHVAGPNAGGEPVLGAVGQRHRLVLGIERHNADDGAEDLLLGDGHAVVDVCEHRRRIVVTAIERRVGKATAAGAEGGAFLNAQFHITLGDLQLLRRNQGAHLRRRIGGVANDDSLGALNESLHEPIMEGTLNQ